MLRTTVTTSPFAPFASAHIQPTRTANLRDLHITITLSKWTRRTSTALSLYITARTLRNDPASLSSRHRSLHHYEPHLFLCPTPRH
jgi:hypothetical protein